jgi:protein phosphatase
MPNRLKAKAGANFGALHRASKTTHRIAPAQAPVSTSHPRSEKTTRRLGPKGFGDLPLHAVVAKRYEVIQQIASRPDGNAYVVVNAQSQKQRILYESANLMQFDREQRWIASQLQHSSLVEMDDAFQLSYGDHSRAYLVVEFPLTPATSLDHCSESQLLEQGIRLGQALALAHEHGLASGSIHPTSLFVSDHRLKLWGSAMPQQLTADSRAQDVYQLAGALYQFATAQGKTRPALSPATMQVFDRALGPDPRARYPNVDSFCEDLQKTLIGLRRNANLTTLVGRLTDVGRMRERDEDALLTTEIIQYTQGGSRVFGLYAVADGMGGASAGEVASRIVVEALARRVTQGILEPCSPSSEGAIDYSNILRTAVEQANGEVFKARQQANNSMGSTLVSALLVGAQAYIANVGDSRAYVLSAGGVRRVTKDHSLVQTLVDGGVIRETEIRSHPQRNYITRNMGDKSEVQVDLFSVTLDPGDSLLLCCDGLWEMVEDDQIRRIVLDSRDPQEACRQLIDTANANGGDDNITCVLVSVENAHESAR